MRFSELHKLYKQVVRQNQTLAQENKYLKQEYDACNQALQRTRKLLVKDPTKQIFIQYEAAINALLSENADLKDEMEFKTLLLEKYQHSHRTPFTETDPVVK